jgi:hypothetical protein
VVKKRTSSFAQRFETIVREFGSRYRLAKASGVAESTLQQYVALESDLPPRADILIKLAQTANVSIEWLATGKGEMRQDGMVSGAAMADVVMIELRDTHAALSAEIILAFLPFSRWWLEHSLDIREPSNLMAIQTNQSLSPEKNGSDLVLVERFQNRFAGEGIYVFEGHMGLILRRIEASLKEGFVVTEFGVSEKIAATDILRTLVGKVIWRGSRQ